MDVPAFPSRNPAADTVAIPLFSDRGIIDSCRVNRQGVRLRAVSACKCSYACLSVFTIDHSLPTLGRLGLRCAASTG